MRVELKGGLVSLLPLLDKDWYLRLLVERTTELLSVLHSREVRSPLSQLTPHC